MPRGTALFVVTQAIALRQAAVIPGISVVSLQPCSWSDDNYAMTTSGLALMVFLGSTIGLFVVFPDPGATVGVTAFAAFNGAYAWLAGRVASLAWEFFVPFARRH